MHIQLNTDSHIQHDQSLTNHVESVLEGALARYGDQVARVQVHLSDVNAGKSGDNDKHCAMELRLDGRPPLAVTEDAATVRGAIGGAARKLQRLVDSSLGKLGH